jgi:hypothetical protein
MSAGKRMGLAYRQGKAENSAKERPNPRGLFRKLVRNQIKDAIRRERIEANRGKGSSK